MKKINWQVGNMVSVKLLTQKVIGRVVEANENFFRVMVNGQTRSFQLNGTPLWSYQAPMTVTLLNKKELKKAFVEIERKKIYQAMQDSLLTDKKSSTLTDKQISGIYKVMKKLGVKMPENILCHSCWEEIKEEAVWIDKYTGEASTGDNSVAYHVGCCPNQIREVS